jgi:hypothetical protein
MNYKRAFIIATVSIAISVVFSFAYKRAIVVVYGQQIPVAWASDFADMNFGEIYQKIGPPQEDVSAKEYQNWLVYQWWGWQMLTVTSNDCCKLTSKPTNIYYTVHVNGWYKPAYIKKIR